MEQPPDRSETQSNLGHTLLNPFGRTETRWMPYPVLDYYVRFVGPTWAALLGLYLSRFGKSPAEARWMLRPLWWLVQLSGAHLEMRGAPLTFFPSEVQSAIRLRAFDDGRANLNSLSESFVKNVFDSHYMSGQQIESLSWRLVHQMSQAGLIEPKASPGGSVWSRTARGRALAEHYNASHSGTTHH